MVLPGSKLNSNTVVSFDWFSWKVEARLLNWSAFSIFFCKKNVSAKWLLCPCLLQKTKIFFFLPSPWKWPIMPAMRQGSLLALDLAYVTTDVLHFWCRLVFLSPFAFACRGHLTLIQTSTWRFPSSDNTRRIFNSTTEPAG